MRPRVQRRKAELTLAQIREKLPNGCADSHQIWHTCKFIWEWIYAKHIAPRDTGGFRGQQFKSLGKLSDWHQLWFTSADSSGNGHRLHTSSPSIPQVAFRGGGGGVRFRLLQIPKSGEAVKWLDRLAPNMAPICRFIWEWIYAKQIALRDTRGALGVYGSNIQKSEEAVKRLDRLAPTLVHVCGFIWEWTHAKSTSPLKTQWHFVGGLGGHKFKCLGKVSNG